MMCLYHSQTKNNKNFPEMSHESIYEYPESVIAARTEGGEIL